MIKTITQVEPQLKAYFPYVFRNSWSTCLQLCIKGSYRLKGSFEVREELVFVFNIEQLVVLFVRQFVFDQRRQFLRDEPRTLGASVPCEVILPIEDCE